MNFFVIRQKDMAQLLKRILNDPTIFHLKILSLDLKLKGLQQYNLLHSCYFSLLYPSKKKWNCGDIHWYLYAHLQDLD